MNQTLYGAFDDDRVTRSLLATGFFMVSLLIVTALPAAFETRTLNGINLWIKPLKFDLAMAVHAFTVAVLAQLLVRKTRDGVVLGAASAAFVASALIENVYITVQAMRGRHSHFNFDTAFEASMYSAMGLGALLLVLAPLLMGVLLWAQHEGERNGFRLGAIAGLIVGPLLTIGVAGYMSMSGSHYVGAPDASDAGGLPLVGWSTTIPDLRPAHFFALHMIQILPLVGWIADRVIPAAARPAVLVAMVANGGLALWLFMNALNGNPLPL